MCKSTVIAHYEYIYERIFLRIIYTRISLIVIGAFYFNGALISQTLCSMQQVTSFQTPTSPLVFSQKINALKIK